MELNKQINTSYEKYILNDLYFKLIKHLKNDKKNKIHITNVV